MKITIFKVWRKLLPFLYVFVLVHFLKDITQDVLKIFTPLDLLGDVKEELSSFPIFIQNLFMLLGVGSFIAEAFLLISIPVVTKRKEITHLEKMVLAVIMALLLFFLVVTLLDPRFSPRFRRTKNNVYFKDYKTIYIELNKRKFLLYVADDPQKREKGLSNVTSLADNQGMIFIFDKPDYYSFWMKDMRFPLDFIFIKDAKIIDLLENIPPQTYPKTFTSKMPADKVIELNSGIIKNLKIKIGDEIK